MPDRRGDPAEPLELDFLKDRYDAELARCNRLTDALGLPIAALTVFGSLISVMFTGFSNQGQALKILFMVLISADCCAFAACLLYLAIAYHRQDVAYLQTLSQFRDGWKALQTADPGAAAKRFEDYVRSSTIEAADLNIESNDRRAGYLYPARVALILVVVLTGLAALPYVVNQRRQPRTVPVVHIDNLDSRSATNAK